MGQLLVEQHRFQSPDNTCNDVAGPGPEELLGLLGTSLAHHVNNALTGVMGYLELALREHSCKGILQNHLRASLACAHQAAETVKRLAAFAAPAIVPAPSALVPLRKVAEEVLASHEELPRDGVQLVLAGEGEGWVQGDPSLIHFVVDSLVRNALEAVAGHGRLALQFGEAEDGQRFLRISDNGPGFSSDAVSHRFEPFWTSKPNGHLGLGLVLARAMLQAQGGNLAITSTPGVGTTATLFLPAGEPEPTLEEAAPATPLLAPSKGAIVSAEA